MPCNYNVISARAIIEAEDPKAAFRHFSAQAGVGSVLERSGWVKHGSGWKFDDRTDLANPWGIARRTVWWDDAEHEWVLKFEVRTRHGLKDNGYRAYSTGKELLRALGRCCKLRGFQEAEDPKHAMRTMRAEEGEHSALR